MKDRIKICSWVKRSSCRIKSPKKTKKYSRPIRRRISIHSKSSRTRSKSFSGSRHSKVAPRKTKRHSRRHSKVAPRKTKRHSRRHLRRVSRRSETTVEVYNRKGRRYIIPLILFLILLGAGYLMWNKNGKLIKSNSDVKPIKSRIKPSEQLIESENTENVIDINGKHMESIENKSKDEYSKPSSKSVKSSNVTMVDGEVDEDCGSGCCINEVNIKIGSNKETSV